MMYPPHFPFSGSGTRASVPCASLTAHSINATPLGAPNALSLTSKQRALSTDLLQRVVRLLCNVSSQMEAAALQEAMKDPAASEFITARMLMTQAAEASTAGTGGGQNNANSTASVTVNTAVDSVSMNPAASPPFALTDTAAENSATSLFSASYSAQDMSKVLKASFCGAAGSTGIPTPPPGATPVSSRVDTARSRRGGSIIDPAYALRAVSFFSAPTSSANTTAAAAPAAARRQHSDIFSPLADVLPPTSSTEHITFANGTHGTGGGAATFLSATESTFPMEWFSRTAVQKLSRPGYAAVAPTAVTDVSNLLPMPRTLPNRNGRSDTVTVMATTPTAPSTRSFASLYHDYGSTSQDTAVYRSMQMLSALTTSITDTTDGETDSSVASTNLFTGVPPAAAATDLDKEDGDCESVDDGFDDRPAVTTAQPLLFLDNMLLDPVSSRFLFGGSAFREEARVLAVPLLEVQPDGHNVGVQEDGILKGGHADSSTSSAGARSAHVSFASTALLLLREYIPVCATSSGRGSGGAVDGIVVQSFSLLPPWLTQVMPSRYQLLSEASTIACVCQALPGCLTLVSPLAFFLREGRSVSFFSAPHGAEPAGMSFMNALLPASGEAGNGFLQRQWGGVGGGVSIGSSFTNAQISGNVGSAKVFLAPHTSDAGAAAADAEAARIAVCDKHLQLVPRDVVDNAIACLLQSLQLHAAQVRQRQRIRRVIRAVEILQRFLRRCLAVKRRAVHRMTRVWRRLEVEARMKLQQHQAVPSAVERLDAVANSVLQEHMLTSSEYKRTFIEEEWARRRRAFDKWKEEEDWNAVFAAEKRRKQDAAKKQKGMAQLSAFEPLAPENGGSPNPTPVTALHTRLTAEDEQRLVAAFRKQHRLRPSSRRVTSRPELSRTASPATVAANSATAFASASATIGPASSAASVPEMSVLQPASETAVIRRFRSWYIDPQELLYLSHQRLLETLKGSILRMEEVQYAWNCAAAEVAGAAAAAPSGTVAKAAAPAHKARSRR